MLSTFVPGTLIELSNVYTKVTFYKQKFLKICFYADYKPHCFKVIDSSELLNLPLTEDMKRKLSKDLISGLPLRLSDLPSNIVTNQIIPVGDSLMLDLCGDCIDR